MTIAPPSSTTGSSDKVDASDDEVARAFAARERWALGESYRRHASLLCSVAQRVLGDAGTAEDCVHDTLVRLWQRRRYRTERGALGAFLVVAVRNDALSRSRQQRRRLQLLPNLFAPRRVVEPATLVEDRELREHVAALPLEQSNVVELAYLQGFTLAETAVELDVPLGTVKSRLHAALRRLASAIGEHRA